VGSVSRKADEGTTESCGTLSEELCKNRCGTSAWIQANGNAITQGNVIYDEPYSNYITFPTPQKAGQIFLGWFTAKNGGSRVNNGDKVSAYQDHTLYAHR
jgi:hypothetical protein